MACCYCSFTFLLFFCTLAGSALGQCFTQNLTTSNFLIQPFTSGLIKVDLSNGIVSTSIAAYTEEDHLKFFYETMFHDCGDGNIYISVKNLNEINGIHYYLANTQVRTPVDTVDVVADDSAPFRSFRDTRLFRYTAGPSVDVTAMESNSQYITASNRSNELIYERNEVFWVTWPYITRTEDDNVTLTYFRAAFTINGQDAAVYVYFSSPTTLSLISNVSSEFGRLTDSELLFEVITWRYYKGFASNGSVITAGAMVVRKPHDNWYITPNVVQGCIPLNKRHCVYKYYYHYYHRQWIRYTDCFYYQTAEFRFYDQISRSRSSTFEQPNIRDQNSIDERFFEAIDDFDGTHKMRSVLDPTKYLAILKVSDSHFKLIMTPLRDDLSGIVNYKFDVLVPPLSMEVRAVPRLPCTPSTPRIPWQFECF